MAVPEADFFAPVREQARTTALIAILRGVFFGSRIIPKEVDRTIRPLRALRVHHGWLEAFPADAASPPLEELSLVGNRIAPADLPTPFAGARLDLSATPLTAEASARARAAGVAV